ncbi:mycofactocin-coupled SDR family oxidoreductase [Pseudonocardia oroxyli]|uniref:SDR family mycofactocin-dependent oxidoreductase n=1 Tax=Pseudonocardia oroxyli TaxID=366584 RepID=A0A1G7TTN0_PSEOR|nr:mycofactocin-coupled SDR family oxidoreductase [Pseudonocardia oroxyli]SDG38706.1 SDR family mycofactocin-dependent oxidoreductase [Pseudonocardia oroxyli]
MGMHENKVAVISGAARGQGRSHAVALAQEGADIIALDICRDIDSMEYPNATPADLAETVAQIEKLDRRVVAREVDVRDAAAVKTAVDEGVAELGRLDIVLPQAGIARYTDAGSYEAEAQAWDDILGVNLSGYYHLIESSIPHLVAGGRGGSIVMTGSTAATRPVGSRGGRLAYMAGKHGAVGLMKVYALALAEHWIRVNMVHPTGVASGMTMNATMEKMAAEAAAGTSGEESWIAKSRNLLDVPMLEPSDITEAVMFLVSDKARYITGEEIKVDAGFSLL